MQVDASATAADEGARESNERFAAEGPTVVTDRRPERCALGAKWAVAQVLYP